MNYLIDIGLNTPTYINYSVNAGVKFGSQIVMI